MKHSFEYRPNTDKYHEFREYERLYKEDGANDKWLWLAIVLMVAVPGASLLPSGFYDAFISIFHFLMTRL